MRPDLMGCLPDWGARQAKFVSLREVVAKGVALLSKPPHLGRTFGRIFLDIGHSAINLYLSYAEMV